MRWFKRCSTTIALGRILSPSGPWRALEAALFFALNLTKVISSEKSTPSLCFSFTRNGVLLPVFVDLDFCLVSVSTEKSSET